jgi:hypothetical protein
MQNLKYEPKYFEFEMENLDFDPAVKFAIEPHFSATGNQTNQWRELPEPSLHELGQCCSHCLRTTMITQTSMHQRTTNQVKIFFLSFNEFIMQKIDPISLTRSNNCKIELQPSIVACCLSICAISFDLTLHAYSLDKSIILICSLILSRC